MSPDRLLGLDASGWIAIGTVTLALTTFGYLIVTLNIARRAERSAVAAETAAEGAQRALLLSALPFLDFYVEGSDPFVENRGNGVALNVLVEIGDVVMLGPIGVVAPGKRIQVPNRRAVNEAEAYKAELTFYDALGNGYRIVKERLIDGTSLFDLFRWDEEARVWRPTTTIGPDSGGPEQASGSV